MDVELDQHALTTAVRAAQDAVAAMRATTADTDRRAMAVLDGWSGDASEDFLHAWSAWRAGALDVADGVATLAGLLAETGADLAAADQMSRGRLERLQARLAGELQ